MAADGRIEIDTRINNDGATEGLRELGDKLNESADKMKETGEGLSKYVTAPLVAVGAAGLKVASDIDSGTGKLQASLGLTNEEAKKLGQVAESVWKNNWGDSIQGVSDDLAIMKQTMRDLPDDQLQAIAESAYTIQSAFGADFKDVSKTANQLMTQFGVSGQHAMDLITVGFQKGGDYSGELLDTLNEYAPQFKSMGMNADQFLNLLISGAQDGAFNLDKVGDAVKEFNLRAKDGSKTTQQGFEMIGMDANKMGAAIAAGGDKGKQAFEATVAALAAMKDPVAQNQAGVALFGTQWEDLQKTVVTGMANSTDALGQVDGATKKAGESLSKSFGSQLQSLWRQSLDSLKPIGEILLSMAKDALPKISNAIKGASDSFNGLSEPVKKFIVVVGMVLAAIGPLIVFVGMIVSLFGTLAGWFAPLIGFFAEAGGLLPGLGAAFSVLTGPVGLIVMAIAALVAIFVYLWKTNEDFRNGVVQLWDEIKEAFNIALTFIMGIVQNVMTNVMAFILDIWGKIKSFWDLNGTMIINGTRTVFGAIWGYIQAVMQFIVGLFQAVWPIISGVVQTAWAIIKTAVKAGIDLVLGIISVALNLLSGNWSGAWDAIKRTVNNIWKDIVNTFKGIDLGKIGSDMIDGLIKGIEGMAGAIGKAVANLSKLIPRGLKDFFGIASPSKLMEKEIGKWIPAGLAKGIDANVDIVTNSVNRMGKSAVPVMPQSLMAMNKIITTGDKSSGNGVTLNMYPQKAVVDETDVVNAVGRMVTLYGL